MVYVEINGWRLGQEALLAIGEGLLAHMCLNLLLLLANLPCFRPKDPKLRWVGIWRAHTTVYAILSLLSEGLWVQYSLLSDTEKSAVGCPWSQARLAAWAGVQLVCLLSLVSALTYMKRASIAHMVNGVVTMHSMGAMTFGMLTMYESGACLTVLFPILAGAIGMINGALCVPWYTGAWNTEQNLGGGNVFALGTQASLFTGTAGWVGKRSDDAKGNNLAYYVSDPSHAYGFQRRQGHGDGDGDAAQEQERDVGSDLFEDVDLHDTGDRGSTVHDQKDLEMQVQKQVRKQQQYDLTCIGWMLARRERKRQAKAMLGDLDRNAPILAMSDASDSDASNRTESTSSDDGEGDSGDDSDEIHLDLPTTVVRKGGYWRSKKERKRRRARIRHIEPPNAEWLRSRTEGTATNHNSGSGNGAVNNSPIMSESRIDPDMLAAWNQAGKAPPSQRVHGSKYTTSTPYNDDDDNNATKSSKGDGWFQRKRDSSISANSHRAIPLKPIRHTGVETLDDDCDGGGADGEAQKALDQKDHQDGDRQEQDEGDDADARTPLVRNNNNNNNNNQVKAADTPAV